MAESGALHNSGHRSHPAAAKSRTGLKATPGLHCKPSCPASTFVSDKGRRHDYPTGKGLGEGYHSRPRGGVGRSQCSMPVQEIWLDQEDAQLLQEGEEVTLMDWGNAIVKVQAWPSCKQTVVCWLCMHLRSRGVRQHTSKLKFARQPAASAAPVDLGNFTSPIALQDTYMVAPSIWSARCVVPASTPHALQTPWNCSRLM